MEITCGDGSQFFAFTGEGILPAIWSLSGRKYAVQFKRELAPHLGSANKCRVVRVEYEDPAPRVIERKTRKKQRENE